MSQVDEIKANAEEIAKGLKRLGPDRQMAMSVHKTKDLIVELEDRAKKLVEQLDSLS